MAGVRYKIDDGPFKTLSEKPWNIFDHTLSALEGEEASFTAIAALTLSWDVGIYWGLVKGSIGLRGGLELAASGGISFIEESVNIPTVNQFDLNVIFSMPLSATALWGGYEIGETHLFPATWPLITLPSTELHKLYDHYCLLQENSGDYARLGLYAHNTHTGYTDNAVIENDFIGSGDWYIVNSDGWFIENARPPTFDGSNASGAAPLERQM